MVNKFHYRFGGAETYYFALSDLLRSAGHEVIPFSMKHPDNEPTPYDRFFVDRVDYDQPAKPLHSVQNGFRSIYSGGAREKMKALIREVGPDLVHLHNYNYQITPSILFEIARAGIPVVQTLHDPQLICPHHRLYDYNKMQICENCRGLKFYRAATTRCIKNSLAKSVLGAAESYLYHSLGVYEKHVQLYIAPSEFLKEKIREFGLRTIQIECLPHFVEMDRPVVQSKNSRICLYYGRLSAEKGILTLVRAMRSVRGGELWIAGDGPLKQAITAELESHSQTNVTLLGQKTKSELATLLDQCAFTVLPSEWYENMPYSVMESFASGRGVVASDRGGLTEMVIAGKTGYLFAPGDERALSDVLNRMFASPSLAKELGVAARAFAELHYSKSVHLPRILSIYQRVRAIA